MDTTSNLGIPLIDGTEGMYVVDWAKTINGSTEDSMAVKVDNAIGYLLNREMYAAAQPTNQKEGDVWHEIISVE